MIFPLKIIIWNGDITIHCLQNDPHDYRDIEPYIYNIYNWLLKFKSYVKSQSSVIFDIIMQIKVNVLINNLIKDKYNQYHMEIVSFIFICKWKKLQYFYIIYIYIHKNKMQITSTQASKVFLCTRSQDLILLHTIICWHGGLQLSGVGISMISDNSGVWFFY